MARSSRQDPSDAARRRDARTSASLQRKADVLAVLAIGSLAGVLIWTKLKLVSPVPRTAFADPPAEEASASEAERNGSDEPAAERVPVRPRAVVVPPIPPGP